MIVEQELNRMRWACRRGMLELDLVLEPFVNECYSHLDAADRQSFVRLLECEDQDLFAWFMRRAIPEDEALVDIVQQILEYTLSRSKSQTV